MLIALAESAVPGPAGLPAPFPSAAVPPVTTSKQYNFSYTCLTTNKFNLPAITTSRNTVQAGNATKGPGADIPSGSNAGPVRIGGVPKKALASVFRIAAKAKAEGGRDGMADGKGKGSTEEGGEDLGVNPSGAEDVEDNGKPEKGKAKGKGKAKAKGKAPGEEEPKKEKEKKEKEKGKRKADDTDDKPKPKRRRVVTPAIVPDSEAEAAKDDEDDDAPVDPKPVSKKAGKRKANTVERGEPPADEMEVDEAEVEEAEEDPVPSAKAKGKAKAIPVKDEPADDLVLGDPDLVLAVPDKVPAVPCQACDRLGRGRECRQWDAWAACYGCNIAKSKCSLTRARTAAEKKLKKAPRVKLPAPSTAPSTSKATTAPPTNTSASRPKRASARAKTPKPSASTSRAPSTKLKMEVVIPVKRKAPTLVAQASSNEERGRSCQSPKFHSGC
jgi:hypothetical protein